MTAPALDFSRFAAIGPCPACQAPLPPAGEPQVCAKCGRVAVVPPVEQWPAELRRWVLFQAVRRLFHAWRTRQDVYEYLLRIAVTGEGPTGRRYAGPFDAGAMFVEGMKRAAAWQASGAPTDPL